MALTRWAPLLMMIVADVFPGGCCGGARYHGPKGPPILSVANHGTADVCQIEWLPADGSGRAQKLTLGLPSTVPEQPLKPPTSRQYPLPAEHFTLRLLDCDGKELMVKKDIDAHGESVFVDYR
jgi:hypothetical protein